MLSDTEPESDGDDVGLDVRDTDPVDVVDDIAVTLADHERDMVLDGELDADAWPDRVLDGVGVFEMEGEKEEDHDGLPEDDRLADMDPAGVFVDVDVRFADRVGRIDGDVDGDDEILSVWF